jgi:integrase
MAAPSYGASTRRPVYSGNRRVPGLYERICSDGSMVYDIRLRLGGKLRRHVLEAATKTDAIAELRKLQVDYERGVQHRSGAAALTVAELADDWLDHLRSRIGHPDRRLRYSARTVGLYEQRLRSHVLPAFGRRAAGELTVLDVRRLLDRLLARKLAPSTVTGVITVLSRLLAFGVRNGQLDRNPVRDLDREDKPGAKRQTEPRYLDDSELDQLLDALTDVFRPVVATCLYSGLRISEALGLRWRDIDLKAGTITVVAQLGENGELVAPKTASSGATVPVLPALARELHAHRQRQAARDLARVRPGSLVFTTTNGKPQDRHNALRAIKKAADNVGLNDNGREPVGLHDLRHSFVSLALAHGATDTEACEAARHAHPGVTMTMYAGLTERDRGAASRKLLSGGFGA